MAGDEPEKLQTNAYYREQRTSDIHMYNEKG